jgi:predicted nucleotidyltransferase
MRAIYQYKTNIENLCKRYNVKTLYAFGSIVTDKFNENSDVDMIVAFKDLPVEDYFDNYYDFKFSLQDVFKRPVDLLEEQTIKNPFFIQNVNHNKKLIYG